MSHKHNAALVDLRNPDNLPTFIYHLHKAIQKNPEISRQQLSDVVAKGLGARSLEAYQAVPVATPMAEADSAEQRLRECWSKRATTWYVLRTQSEKYLQGGGCSPYYLSADLTQDLVVVNEEDAKVIASAPHAYLPDAYLAKINHRTTDALIAERFQKSLPEVFASLSMDHVQLREYCKSKSHDEHSCAEYTHFGLERDTWKEEAGAGDTQLSYWEWVASQLELFSTDLDHIR